MTLCYDVAIVGGGIAGSALGGTLAAAGLGVVIVEKEPAFRDRVRGEAVHPWGVAEADRLGLLPVLKTAGANDLPIWQSYADRTPSPPYHWADDSIGGLPELAVSHPRLQETLLAWAEARGVDVLRPARTLTVRPGPELVVTHGTGERTLCARLVVGADGRRSNVRRWIGATTVRDPVHHRIGGALLDQVALDSKAAHDAGFPGGRLIVLPQGNDRARAYFIASADRLAASHADRSAPDFIRACSLHLPEDALAAAVPAGPAAFFPNADVWADPIAAAGAVLIGDAAGANDPSVGQGLSIAFRDVRALRDLLLDGRDWAMAVDAFAERRRCYYDVLRAHAGWLAMLIAEEGPDANARRDRVARAREFDPSAGGFSLIFARGPDGLVVDDVARRRFFGEDAA